VRAVWSLDRDLAYARHYPAVSWRDSSARDVEQLRTWQAEHGDPGWVQRRAVALRLLTDADRIESIAQLVGADSLPGRERITLRTARLLREGVLQQSALLENDQFSSPAKQRALLTLVLDLYERLIALLDRGVPVAELEAVDLSSVLRARYDTAPDGAAEVEQIGRELMRALEGVGQPAR
jgi:V/A-type H+-transporting ATPase subunit A